MQHLVARFKPVHSWQCLIMQVGCLLYNTPVVCNHSQAQPIRGKAQCLHRIGSHKRFTVTAVPKNTKQSISYEEQFIENNLSLFFLKTILVIIEFCLGAVIHLYVSIHTPDKSEFGPMSLHFDDPNYLSNFQSSTKCKAKGPQAPFPIVNLTTYWQTCIIQSTLCL